ncbi:MAG TPA: CHAD domain-containing protein, partial [Saprospiraceae bacterium]|nr:CHAD domain-containing protein [Saprospiraceae bacterium]
TFEIDLDRQIKKEKKQFFKLIKSSLLKNIKRNRSRVSGFIDNINHKTATKYLRKKSNAIHKVLLNDHVDPSSLHEIRKQIKDMYYVQKMIEPKNSQITRTDKLQELLGQWHDGRVLLQELDEYLNAHEMPLKDKKPYEALKTKMMKENEARFRLIMEQKPALLQLFP